MSDWETILLTYQSYFREKNTLSFHGSFKFDSLCNIPNYTKLLQTNDRLIFYNDVIIGVMRGLILEYESKQVQFIDYGSISDCSAEAPTDGDPNQKSFLTIKTKNSAVSVQCADAEKTCSLINDLRKSDWGDANTGPDVLLEVRAVCLLRDLIADKKEVDDRNCEGIYDIITRYASQWELGKHEQAVSKAFMQCLKKKKMKPFWIFYNADGEQTFNLSDKKAITAKVQIGDIKLLDKYTTNGLGQKKVVNASLAKEIAGLAFIINPVSRFHLIGALVGLLLGIGANVLYCVLNTPDVDSKFMGSLALFGFGVVMLIIFMVDNNGYGTVISTLITLVGLIMVIVNGWRILLLVLAGIAVIVVLTLIFRALFGMLYKPKKDGKSVIPAE